MMLNYVVLNDSYFDICCGHNELALTNWNYTVRLSRSPDIITRLASGTSYFYDGCHVCGDASAKLAQAVLLWTQHAGNLKLQDISCATGIYGLTIREYLDSVGYNDVEIHTNAIEYGK